MCVGWVDVIECMSVSVCLKGSSGCKVRWLQMLENKLESYCVEYDGMTGNEVVDTHTQTYMLTLSHIHT